MALRWTFHQRLALGLVAVIALGGVIAAAAILAVDALGSVRESVAFQRARDIADVELLRVLAEKKVASSRAYLLTGEERFRLETYSYRDRFLEALGMLRDRAQGSGGDLLAEAARAERAHQEALERVFREHAGETFDRTIAELWEREVAPRRQALDGALGTLESQRRELLLEAESRSEQTVRRAIALVGLTAGIALLFASVLGLLLARTLGRLYCEAELAIRRRDEFLSVASHELKTPLTTLLMQTQLLERTSHEREMVPAEEVQRRSRILARSTLRLKRLLDDVDEYVRARGGQLALQREELDLAELAAEVVRRFERDRPDARGAILLELDVPVKGAWDRARLEMALTSLIDNALDHGKPPIVVCVRQEDGRAHLEVRDHGGGIAAPDRTRIFEPYERVRGRSDAGGLGLGLFLAQHVAAAHGGAVRLAAQRAGIGARFILELPLVPA